MCVVRYPRSPDLLNSLLLTPTCLLQPHDPDPHTTSYHCPLPLRRLLLCFNSSFYTAHSRSADRFVQVQVLEAGKSAAHKFRALSTADAEASVCSLSREAGMFGRFCVDGVGYRIGWGAGGLRVTHPIHHPLPLNERPLTLPAFSSSTPVPLSPSHSPSHRPPLSQHPPLYEHPLLY